MIRRLIDKKTIEQNKKDLALDKEVRKKLQELGLEKKHIDYILRKR